MIQVPEKSSYDLLEVTRYLLQDLDRSNLDNNVLLDHLSLILDIACS